MDRRKPIERHLNDNDEKGTLLLLEIERSEGQSISDDQSDERASGRTLMMKGSWSREVWAKKCYKNK